MKCVADALFSEYSLGLGFYADYVSRFFKNGGSGKHDWLFA